MGVLEAKNFHIIYPEMVLVEYLQLGLPGVMQTKTGLDKYYRNFFIKKYFYIKYYY